MKKIIQWQKLYHDIVLYMIHRGMVRLYGFGFSIREKNKKRITATPKYYIQLDTNKKNCHETEMATTDLKLRLKSSRQARRIHWCRAQLFHTSVTVNSKRNFCTLGLTFLIVLRSTLIVGMDPPDLTFFLENTCKQYTTIA